MICLWLMIAFARNLMWKLFLVRFR